MIFEIDVDSHWEAAWIRGAVRIFLFEALFKKEASVSSKWPSSLAPTDGAASSLAIHNIIYLLYKVHAKPLSLPLC